MNFLKLTDEYGKDFYLNMDKVKVFKEAVGHVEFKTIIYVDKNEMGVAAKETPEEIEVLIKEIEKNKLQYFPSHLIHA